MSGSGSGPLVPTFQGFVQNSMDGLMLFEACLSGKLHHVPRRPHDRERSTLIRSGSVFIYEENASGIKRWTDGVAWSPSRILGNFLIYRELEKPFPPGEKKRAMKRKRSSQVDGENGRRESEDREAGEVSMPPTPPSPKPLQDGSADSSAQDTERELDRQLIGSLVDSYGFRPDGLVKKTMSIAINGVSHHLVSYYKVEDVKKRVLQRPVEDARLAGLTIRPELYLKQNFRTPVEETEQYIVDPNSMHAHPAGMYSSMIPGGYAMRPPPAQYMSPPGYPVYGASAWPSQPSNLPAAYGSQSYAPATSQYPTDYYQRPTSQAIKPEEGTHASPSYHTSNYQNHSNYQHPTYPQTTSSHHPTHHHTHAQTPTYQSLPPPPNYHHSSNYQHPPRQY
ncbi:hypothetical protein CAC42_600 [Sphaceloma murrayae]|uniref:Global transcription regulator sge1 n=1 Tax=Sphaceloma murrayae TaxID=2082308 RepID=A0A2K1QK64_9PEZI|nr:hypothetical protein CAC42_600 [Sphaceloma murrayae]